MQASGLGQTKNVKRPPGRSPLSIQRPQPSLIQLPLLLQEHGKVVHGDQRVRMIRAEVRFAPCKSSAVQGLRLASWRWEQYRGPGDVILSVSMRLYIL